MHWQRTLGLIVLFNLTQAIASEGGWPIAVSDDLVKALTEAELPFTMLVRNGLNVISSALQSSQIPLDVIDFNADEQTSVKLFNLSLLAAPQLHLIEIVPDLSLLNLRIDSGLGSLQVQGVCGEQERGNISVTLREVAVSGLIGLTLSGDSFTANTVDLAYLPEEVTVNVTHHNDQDQRMSNAFSSDTVNGSLASPFYGDLSYQLNQLVKQQLNVVLSNITLAQVLGDEALVETYKAYTKQLSATLNDIADFVLGIVRSDVAETGHNQILVQDLDQELFKTNKLDKVKGRFKAEGGWFKDLSGLKRVRDVTVSAEGTAFTVTCPLSLEIMQFGYDNYEIEYLQTKSKGSITGQIGNNAISLKVTLDLGSGICHTTLNEFTFLQLKDLSIEVTNKDSISSLLPIIQSRITGQVKGHIISSSQRRLTVAMNNALDRFHCEELFS